MILHAAMAVVYSYGYGLLIIVKLIILFVCVCIIPLNIKTSSNSVYPRNGCNVSPSLYIIFIIQVYCLIHNQYITKALMQALKRQAFTCNLIDTGGLNPSIVLKNILPVCHFLLHSPWYWHRCFFESTIKCQIALLCIWELPEQAQFCITICQRINNPGSMTVL